jgi:OmpA-OmpF porin, OOP family
MKPKIYLAGIAAALMLPAGPVNAQPASDCRTSVTIYFELEKSDLLSNGQQILEFVTKQASRCDNPLIIVVGHMDAAETQGEAALDMDRANMIAQRLRNQLPGTPVLTQWLGFSNPAVATEAGVRDPLNRRVEIHLR